MQISNLQLNRDTCEKAERVYNKMWNRSSIDQKLEVGERDKIKEGHFRDELRDENNTLSRVTVKN